ncbi:MAG: phytoene/squalene synthase family protein [Pseudomonadota bacterium]
MSRTFALTIPQLPPALREAVTNAYLLCRIADTIEDEAALNAAEKSRFHDEFVAVVEGAAPAGAFAGSLDPLLTGRTVPAERELVRNTARIVRVTHSFADPQRSALQRCVAVMCRGMPGFARKRSLAGLETLEELNRYCYCVAGVVGEMLTSLFCDHSPRIARHRQRLMGLAVSFGQGLQMTNILKDIWDDRRSATCWLPREIFNAAGFELSGLDAARHDKAFAAGLKTLVGVAHGHLQNALTYTLTIPRDERGIRRFCLWAIGLAVLTLRGIHRRPDFTEAGQIKVSRRALKATIVATNLTAGSNAGLRALFALATAGLPAAAALEAPAGEAV